MYIVYEIFIREIDISSKPSIDEKIKKVIIYRNTINATQSLLQSYNGVLYNTSNQLPR